MAREQKTQPQVEETEARPQVGTVEGATEATVDAGNAAEYTPKVFVRGDVEREATSLAREYALKFDGFVEKDKK